MGTVRRLAAVTGDVAWTWPPALTLRGAGQAWHPRPGRESAQVAAFRSLT
jgi:hypothetical protein